MKRIIIASGLLLAVVLGVSTANARGLQPYAGLGVGVFNFDANVIGINDSGSGGGAFAILGADFTPNIGGELRIGATGNASLHGLQYKFNNFFSYLAKFQFPATRVLDIYGLVGGTSAKITTSGGANVTKTGLSFGAGVNVQVANRVSIGGEYVRYWNAVATVPGLVDVTVDGLAATVKFNF